MSTTTVKSGTELFSKYINKYKDQVKTESSEEYYHVNVVADAYNQGFSDGKNSGKKDFVEAIVKGKVEKFIQKANQVYILSQNLITHLVKQGYKADSLYINMYPNCPKVVLSISDEFLLDDKFVETAYEKILENKGIFTKLFAPSSLDISLVSTEHLDPKLLKEDGFGYEEVLKAK
ncbi:hypothetical protein N7E81_02410 [Reichenbachiella carrageenanivorans]|uniref:Uncharacterized protein n=1 Tax=Reichenbachiella carrageenanivorans TaxID=2979869 RepID=A0ABY6D1B8_9BACT|nr:hypothetical protein [Reichenbachiella carrageenanivorans]UXX79957.1 hypothetical protein N7E81_02410 [Reichenbachiella carrageenanivorans]